jgi:hypothetical protein
MNDDSIMTDKSLDQTGEDQDPEEMNYIPVMSKEKDNQYFMKFPEQSVDKMTTDTEFHKP